MQSDCSYKHYQGQARRQLKQLNHVPKNVINGYELLIRYGTKTSCDFNFIYNYRIE